MIDIVLNESEVLQDALNGRYDEKKVGIVLRLLLKHYYISGMTDQLQLREQLLNFLKNHYNGYKRGKWEETIAKMVEGFIKTVRKNKVDVKFVDIKEIPITQRELESIVKLNDIVLEKLAFVMLIYAKISNIIMNSSEGWINKSSSTICKEAKVNLKGIEKEKTLHKLYVDKYIEQRKRNNKTNLRICYINEDSEVEMTIRNFDNIVYNYILWKNKDMIPCEECGRPVKKSSNKTKYCSVCAKEIWRRQHREINREYMRKKRTVDKIEKSPNTLV